ncbi:tetratricopeptide repeat protein [Hyphococcus flavus]|uniref:Tetratricopeptide repeat protein n=1 Tax=Hyphococcus flavus TaxID=1866326 RepID=A0AAE9ZF18_9PROT|nr:tetratricopeptide repeat protein [Hyphococcus flavus]WDI31487.1 tetratricopeptide repeat protein [Hyphococcus flavus]
MANDESVLREVDQELAEERQWAMFRRHGPAVISIAAAVVIGVAGWQVWNYTKTSAAEKSALEYREAISLLEDDQTAGRAALEAVAAERSGYGVLATMQRAGSYAAGGERLKAIETYRQVANGSAPKQIRDLARVRAAHLSLADGRDAVLAELDGLQDSTGRYSYFAREVAGLAAFQVEDYETAFSTFQMLSLDMEAPVEIRDRAEEFGALAQSAKAGVNVTGEARLEDLLRTVGQDSLSETDTVTNDESVTSAEDNPAEEGAQEDVADDHTGHDHEE